MHLILVFREPQGECWFANLLVSEVLPPEQYLLGKAEFLAKMSVANGINHFFFVSLNMCFPTANKMTLCQILSGGRLDKYQMVTTSANNLPMVTQSE